MKQQKKEGALVPVKITGTYDKPSFDVDALKSEIGVVGPQGFEPRTKGL